MDFYSYVYDNKDKIGKVLFVVSVIAFVYMFFSPLSQTYINVDEHFTVNILKLPTMDFINKLVTDGHPPGYYFPQLIVGYILSLFNIPVDYFRISKILATATYGILLFAAATKLKRDYGWFTAGLFAFALATLSEFFVQFVSARSYGLDILLLVMAFVYLKDVLFKSDRESWILFIVFSVLAGYSHYYSLFPVGFMYLMIIGNILKNKMSDFKSEFKKVILAAIASVILYLPELYILRITMSTPHTNGSTSKPLLDLISYFAIGKYQSGHLDVVFFKIIAILFLIAVVIIAVKRYREYHQNEDTYVLLGISLFFLTLLLGYFVLPIKFGALTGRYLSPVIAIFWLSTAIMMERIQSKKIFTVLLVVILLLSCAGAVFIADQTTVLYNNGINEEKTLDMINGENSVVVYQYGNVYHNYHYKLNDTKEYAVSLGHIPYDNNVTISKNIPKIMDDNPGKDVYVIKPVKNKQDKQFGENITSEVLYDGSYTILKLEKKT